MKMPSNILRIRNLPQELDIDDVKQLLNHFGATDASQVGTKFRKNVVLASFENVEDATIALQKLHQIEILGKVLTVEYACSKNEEYSLENLESSKTKGDDSIKVNNYKSFLDKLNSWNSSLKFTQPPPPYLQYDYPSPTGAILTNIVRALISIPKFYTQVLHLMNRLNLPCPFDTVYPFVQADIIIKEKTETDAFNSADEVSKDYTDAIPCETSETESEIESDNDSFQGEVNTFPMKRTLPQKKNRIRRPKLIKSTQQSFSQTVSKVTQKPEDVFEKSNNDKPERKILMKLNVGSEMIQQDMQQVSAGHSENVRNETASSGFGLIFPKDKASDETDKHEYEDDSTKLVGCISEKELSSNRISLRDQKHLPVFKNYQPGIPACRLYVKNIAKQVTDGDLQYIYRRYFKDDIEDCQNMFDIRLMKEGRMKGQAFITLQNVELAQKALQETNGYILKNKPLVVQFARSSNTKDSKLT